ncbi:MAG: hypothetical protein NVSMB9_14770 [Isosphaeraceae bacterium]
MNFLILGNGSAERDWARTILSSARHRLTTSYPGFPDISDAPASPDLDHALAKEGVEAVVVGGNLDFRAEALRRVAAEGLPAICLHPPGDDSEAYYQVSMSRVETGAVIVPDLPARLHPGIKAFQQALQEQGLEGFRSLRYETTVNPSDGDLTRHVFARAVDLIRALLGEVEAVTATGDPPGERPVESLVVQLRGPGSRRAEVRLWSGTEGPARLIFQSADGSLTLELPPRLDDPVRLTRQLGNAPEEVITFDTWNPREAILAVLEEAMAGRVVHPDLEDGTRAMEVSEGAVRSLRRGRTIDLHYEEISESGTFKSVMTSVGCMVLLSILILVPIALAGPALGIGWTIYIAYAIPPVLIGFVLLQGLRFATRGSRKR